MLRILSSSIKNAQSYLDEMGDVDWGDEDFESPWDQYLVDEIESEEEQETPMAEEILPETPVAPQPEISEVEGPITLSDGETVETEKEYINVDELLQDAMADPPHLIKFDYTTRDGRFTGDRIVEPHRIYTAMTTGNEILLTFDRSVGDIRGFIIGNIKPFGVMYKNTFQRRPEIMKPRNVPTKIRPVRKGR